MKDGDYIVNKWGSIKLLQKSILYPVTSPSIAFLLILDCATVNKNWLKNCEPYYVVVIGQN